MPNFHKIITALNSEFPKPRVDSEWLEQCCTWIAEEKHLSVTANYNDFLENVRDQLLKSDLKDSMQHGTGLPNVSGTRNLSGPPVLVQILAIKDIGVSAFQLEQVRAAREERMLSGVGDEEGEDGDVEVEGEGPMPKYPRGTLFLKLSDGATEFEAMEYRPIPQLVLGITKLGYKMQLNKTRFLNGTALLEPATIKLIGGENVELHDQWHGTFQQYLQARLMGQVEETQGAPRSMLPPPISRASRTPLRDISPHPPTLHDDDIDMEPRRKHPTNDSSRKQNAAISKDSRAIKPFPTRNQKNETLSKGDSIAEILPGRSLPKRETSTDDLLFSSTPRDLTESRLRLTEKRNQISISPDPSDFNVLSMSGCEVNENASPLRPSLDKGKGPATDQDDLQVNRLDDHSSDYDIDGDNMFNDDRFWEVLNRVEKEALEDGERSNTMSISPIKNDREVIEVDDSDEETNKENAFVPMRHIRRKGEDLYRGRSPTTNQTTNRTSSQRKIDSIDIIDISDSD